MKKVKYSFYIILLMFVLAGCNDKVNSLEYQVNQLEEELSEVQIELNELKVEIKSNTQFEKEMQYQELFDRLNKRWNNIVGCYYSAQNNTCIVKYMKDGDVKESRIEDMEDN